MLISAIVTTYNRPDALRAVLAGLLAQADRGFEILIADDGSRGDTRELVETTARGSPVALRHVWQEDKGFRAGAARNRAAAAAGGEYLIFLDGDCVPRPDWIAQHRALAEPRWMVAGNRILLSETFTRLVLASGTQIHAWTTEQWRAAAEKNPEQPRESRGEGVLAQRAHPRNGQHEARGGAFALVGAAHPRHQTRDREGNEDEDRPSAVQRRRHRHQRRGRSRKLGAAAL